MEYFFDNHHKEQIMKKMLISVLAFSCAAATAAGLEGWTVVSQDGDSAKFQHQNGVVVEMKTLGKLDTNDQAAEAVGQIIAKSGLKCEDPFELNDSMMAVDCDGASMFFRYAESDKELVMGVTQCSDDACVPVVELLNQFDKQ